MGTSSGNQKSTKTTAKSAVDLFPFGAPSESRQQGRRLVLKFLSKDEPELDRIEYHDNASPKHEYRQFGGDDKTRSFKAAKFSKAIAIFFLDYLCARFKNPPKHFLLEGGDSTLAAALGNAIANKKGSWGRLFVEFLPNGEKANRIEKIFGGKNWGGYPAKHRTIWVKLDYLPPDCIEIFWNYEFLDKPGKRR